MIGKDAENAIAKKSRSKQPNENGSWKYEALYLVSCSVPWESCMYNRCYQKLAREQNKARGLSGAGYESSTVGETNPQLADMSDSRDLLLRTVGSAMAMPWV